MLKSNSLKPPFDSQLILDYSIFFGQDPPEDRLSLVRHISKTYLLVEIGALNYRLKPSDTVYQDESRERQTTELQYFTKDDQLFNRYFAVYKAAEQEVKNYPNIFNRMACVFAIEEITNSEHPDSEDFIITTAQEWESILKYLLAVNFHITQIKKEREGDKPSLERLNPKMIALSELRVKTDPIFMLNRGEQLLQFLSSHAEYGKFLTEYFQKTYSLSYRIFLYLILDIYNAKLADDPEHNFFYQIANDEDLKVFGPLSRRIKSTDLLRLVGVKKSPFVHIRDKQFILADNAMLLEKMYYQFINDFWFDCLKEIKDDKGKAVFKIDGYRGEIGYFFEGYVREVLTHSLENYKHSVFLAFDELKIRLGKREIELSDVYFRYGNKALIGQVKSGSIYDNEKYSGDIDSLYKNDRDEFFSNFGVNQLVQSVQSLNTNILVVDPKFPIGHSCEIFPCILVNDKAFQTPFMNHVFNLRFQELMAGFASKKMRIHPLRLIHIDDIDGMEMTLNENPKLLWEYLRYDFKVKGFLMPFYATLRKLNPSIKYSPKISERVGALIKEYEVNNKQAL